MSQPCEIHFQEGFSGQHVVVAVDGEVRLEFEARTRFQTGLARLERIRLDPGQVVSVAVSEDDVSDEYQVDEDVRWIAVNLVDNHLSIRPQKSGPGYV